MRRRRKSRSISFMTAVIVEVGAMLGIVAVAQPSWTRGLIEHVASPAASAVVEAAMATTLGANIPPADNGASRYPANSLSTRSTEPWLAPVAQWPAAQMPASPVPAAQWPATGWHPAASHVAQLNTPAHSPGSSITDQRSQPVLPPPVASLSAPAWGSGDGWIDSLPGRRY